MNQSSVDGISSMTRHSVWPLLSTIPVIQMEPKKRKPVYLSNHSSVQEDKHEAMEIVVDEMKEEEETLLQSQV